MDRKEQLRQAIVGDYRDREWTYKKAEDHSNYSEFRRRMEMRRKLIPVTTYTVVQPTEK
jgi:hypothetical protein